MSEDKSDGKTINLNALPSCIDEPVKEVLTPGAKEIGGLFGDLLSLATGKIHFAAEKRRIQQEHDLQVFKEGLTKKLEEKPKECLIEPRLQVVGPAMERAAYCLGRFNRDNHTIFKITATVLMIAVITTAASVKLLANSMRRSRRFFSSLFTGFISWSCPMWTRYLSLIDKEYISSRLVH